MRKNLKEKSIIVPMPVLIIGTYDKDGKPNAMNAAWGGMFDYNQIFISLSEHKTTDNLKLKKAFTIAFATKDTEKISDYFGIVSGRNEDKIKKANVHVSKAQFVDAPVIEEYPLCLECKVNSFSDGNLIGDIVNVSVDEKYLDKDGKVDVDKMGIITYDALSQTYRELGKIVGKAFKDGLNLK